MSRNAAEEDRQHEVIQDERVGEVEQPEQPAARHRLDAVLAAGERRLQAEEEHHLRERQRDHREIDALPADGERAADEPQRRGGEHAERDRGLRREAPGLGRIGGNIARRAEEHRVPERQQPAEADQQVERAGEEREAQRLHQEHRVDPDVRRHGEGHRHRRGRQDERAPLPGGRRGIGAGRRDNGLLRSRRGHAVSAPCRRARPA